MSNLKDPRFKCSPTFEGFDVEDFRHMWWAEDGSALIVISEEKFSWPSAEQIEEAWDEHEKLAVDLAEEMNEDLDLEIHEEMGGTGETGSSRPWTGFCSSGSARYRASWAPGYC